MRPFFSDKYDITKHKQYHLLSDYDQRNAFDIEKYMRNMGRAKVRDTDIVEEIFDAGEL